MITAKAFADKHYAVYGLARSGIATVEALLASVEEALGRQIQSTERAWAGEVDGEMGFRIARS